MGIAAAQDTDGDGAPDLVDVCPSTPDPDQRDLDGDGVGDACDRPYLALGGPVVWGATTELIASGMGTGERVWFWGAAGSGGAGPCPPTLGGLCLDLGAGAVPLGFATAGADGVAALTTTVPGLVVPDGRYVLQATIRRGPDSVSSEVLDVHRHLDWDGDGLLDLVEAQLGTDPAAADTDGDGLSDLAEIVGATDPTNADTDGDGVADGSDRCGNGDDALDADGDGVADACDLCRLVADPGQSDTDGDGVGDACETTTPLASSTVFSLPQLEVMFGSAVTGAGDLNGDGYDDVAIGAWAFDATASDQGAVAVFLGGPGGLTPVPDWLTVGAAWDLLGTAIASAGDVNGDGYDDLLVGAPATSRGRALLYLGGPAGPVSPAAWSVVGDAFDHCGETVAGAGDVDGDGFDDVLVGCSGVDGRVDLYLGGPAGPDRRPAWSRSVPVTAPAVIPMAAGDVNGDGFGDLVVGETGYDDVGRVLLFAGSPSGPTARPVWTGIGAQAGDTLGFRVATADVNGDGYDDVLASHVPTWIGQSGVLVWLGSPLGVRGAPVDLRDPDVDARFGEGLANAGDVNGDGFEDVLIGAPMATHDQDREGAAYLFLGSADGLRTSWAWSGESDQHSPSLTGTEPASGYGSVVAGAGDVDGDGLDDVLVSAPSYDTDGPGPGNRWDLDGRVWLFRGQTP
ncbi:MAG: FG-GAP repeat protein [Alphaproteobacteria bacterium]|nr:FG-GAP repeat protein [Alphaproteobacteria bacterium]